MSENEAMLLVLLFHHSHPLHEMTKKDKFIHGGLCGHLRPCCGVVPVEGKHKLHQPPSTRKNVG